MLHCKRCAAVLEFDKELKKEVYRIISDPTIGEVRSLRRKGAVICHQIQYKVGNEIHKIWVTDNGTPIVHRTDYL